MPDDDDLPPEPGEPVKRFRPSKLDAVREHVGVLSDAEVGAMVGVTASAVHMYRKSHGISRSGLKGGWHAQKKVKPTKATAATAPGAPPPVPEPSEPVAPNGHVRSVWAWKVTLGPDLVRYVVAADATTAAGIAAKHGEVVSIAKIGEGFS